MKIESREYIYRTQLEWMTERKGVLKSDGKPNITVACPPEWGGHIGIWSPEDLFVASIEVCVMTTFLWLAEKENVNPTLYRSKATGIANINKGVFQFSTVHISLIIGLAKKQDKAKAERLITEIKKWCMVSNSIKSDIKIEVEIVMNPH